MCSILKVMSVLFWTISNEITWEANREDNHAKMGDTEEQEWWCLASANAKIYSLKGNFETLPIKQKNMILDYFRKL